MPVAKLAAQFYQLSMPARPIHIMCGKTHIGTCDYDRHGHHRIDGGFILGEPIKELQQGVHLIIMTAVREREELALKIGQPGGFRWQQDATGFEPALVAAHSSFLVGLGMAPPDIQIWLLFQQLNQPHAAACILNNDEVGFPPRFEQSYFLLHLHGAAADVFPSVASTAPAINWTSIDCGLTTTRSTWRSITSRSE